VDQAEIRAALRAVVSGEGEALLRTADTIDDAWVQAVQILLTCKGKVVFFGMGKAGHMGRKLAATFSSLGTPSQFVNAAEAVHGDMGMISAGDVVVALSHSGETQETVAPLATVKSLGTVMIAITSRPASTMAKLCDLVIAYPVAREADPMGLAPTASSTAMVAIGDALAVTVAQLRQFSPADFARFHPGGALGAALRGSVSTPVRSN
jgi:arabinose-5-phosphate isomerase